MLVIDRADFAEAVERLMIAARTVTDEQGLRIMADTPRRAPTQTTMRLGTADSDVNPMMDAVDWPRIQAITLGAIVALLNGPCRLSDEVHMVGFPKAEAV